MYLRAKTHEAATAASFEAICSGSSAEPQVLVNPTHVLPFALFLQLPMTIFLFDDCVFPLAEA